MDDNKINDLENQIDELKTQLFTIQQEIKYSKENELKEFLVELYNAICDELIKKNNKHYIEEYEKLSKTDVLNNLKSYIEEFRRNNRFL